MAECNVQTLVHASAPPSIAGAKTRYKGHAESVLMMSQRHRYTCSRDPEQGQHELLCAHISRNSCLTHYTNSMTAISTLSPRRYRRMPSLSGTTDTTLQKPPFLSAYRAGASSKSRATIFLLYTKANTCSSQAVEPMIEG